MAEPHRSPQTNAIADWIAAQEALLTCDAPDWEVCERLIEASKAVSQEISPLHMTAPVEAFPLNLAPGVGNTDRPAWQRFVEADQRLKLILAEGWIAAARLCTGVTSPPEAVIRRWAAALDETMAKVSASERYTKALVEWLRAGLAAGLPMRPPATPVPPSPPIANSPREIIWQDGRVTLSRYEGARRGTPLLIVHGLIGRQTVCDLEDDRSIVATLLGTGADIWVIDWGNPARGDQTQGFTDHLERWIARAAQTMADLTERKPALMGICQGGLFVLCHAARNPDSTAGIALTGTPVDFHADLSGEEGCLNRLARSLPEDVIEGLLAPDGLLPGAMTGALFQAMTPGRTFKKYTVDLAEKLTDPRKMATFARMEAWLADRPDLPGGVAREWLIDLYQKNALVAGAFRVGGGTIDLSRIRCPILNIVAENDHIVPPDCSRALAQYVPNAAYRTIEVPTGHIGVFVSEAAKDRVAPGIAGWLAAI
ncbi:MAG: alpha/beta fold hydrolase [Pseudomonadota bacterium]